jgi:small nuclear ribonucleoprotein (snRNP)-like protein
MTVKELIGRLRTFDPGHNVVIQANYVCGKRIEYNDVLKIVYENGLCIIRQDGD